MEVHIFYFLVLVTTVHKKKGLANKRAFNYVKYFKIWKISRHFVIHAILFLLSYTCQLIDTNCGLKISAVQNSLPGKTWPGESFECINSW